MNGADEVNRQYMMKNREKYVETVGRQIYIRALHSRHVPQGGYLLLNLDMAAIYTVHYWL